jgi:16S rRNA (cytidine1402-2'-O)-methyltransferase
MGYNPTAMTKLHLVATPIGNLEDISQRALRVLGEVGLIAAEDTRRTRQLLAAYGITTPLTSYHEHNKKSKLPQLLARLEKGDVALVCDAGMPGISDPGYDLVHAAVEHKIPVVVVPGPSVLPVALAVSGLPVDQFIYLGFLPRRKSDRRKLLRSINSEWRTIIAFEAPHRVLASLKDIEEILGDRNIAVCRELTKIHEEVYRGSVSGAKAYFSQPKGEFTFVIEGCEVQEAGTYVTDFVKQEINRFHREGYAAKEAVAKLAYTTGLPRNVLYKAWLEHK